MLLSEVKLNLLNWFYVFSSTYIHCFMQIILCCILKFRFILFINYILICNFLNSKVFYHLFYTTFMSNKYGHTYIAVAFLLGCYGLYCKQFFWIVNESVSKIRIQFYYSILLFYFRYNLGNFQIIITVIAITLRGDKLNFSKLKFNYDVIYVFLKSGI